MKYLFFFLFSFLIIGCTNSKKVYWCGDHACINNSEKKEYFKKTMIVEIRKLDNKKRNSMTDLEIIKKNSGIENKKNKKDSIDQSKLNNKINNSNKKELAKQARLEEKRRIKNEKELAKQARLEEKRRIKNEEELTEQVRLDEKKRFKSQKKLSKQTRLEEKKKVKDNKNKLSNDEKIDMNISFTSMQLSQHNFNKIVENIYKRNMNKSYPDINDTPK